MYSFRKKYIEWRLEKVRKNISRYSPLPTDEDVSEECKGAGECVRPLIAAALNGQRRILIDLRKKEGKLLKALNQEIGRSQN